MNMLTFHEFQQNITRRYFFSKGSHILGGAALASLMGSRALANTTAAPAQLGSIPTHFPGKVKQIIYLHLTGSPPNLDVYDYKPELVKRNGQDCPQTFGRTYVCIHFWHAEIDGNAPQVRSTRPVGRLAFRCGAEFSFTRHCG